MPPQHGATAPLDPKDPMDSVDAEAGFRRLSRPSIHHFWEDDVFQEREAPLDIK